MDHGLMDFRQQAWTYLQLEIFITEAVEQRNYKLPPCPML
jgi:hypothetical protein